MADGQDSFNTSKVMKNDGKPKQFRPKIRLSKIASAESDNSQQQMPLMPMQPVGARGGQNYGVSMPNNFQDFMYMMFDYFGNAKTAIKQDAQPMDQAHAMAA